MKQREKNRKQKPNGYLYRGLGIIFGVVLLSCLILMGRNAWKQKEAQMRLEELAISSQTDEGQTEQVPDGAQTADILEQRGIKVPEKNLDWEALRKENKDIYAWIYIPGTQVDYPILQHETENDYYLNHNLDGSSGYPGCIYTQLLNGKEFYDPNTVLYGHNMGNGTMFGSLHAYEDNTFLEENPYVYVYTEENVLVYEIFAACTFSDVHLLQGYKYVEEEGFDAFVDDLKSVRDMKSHVRDSVEVSYGDYLLTMSTCIKNKPTQRYLVVAVLLNS